MICSLAEGRKYFLLKKGFTMKSFMVTVASLGLILSSCVPGSRDGRESSERESVRVFAAERTGPAAWTKAEEQPYDAFLIKEVQKKATFEFYNKLIYRDSASWKGQIVCLLGYYPGSSVQAREYVTGDDDFFLGGDYNGHPINMLVQLDHALPVQPGYGTAVPRLQPEQKIFVFGKLGGVRQFLSEEGYGRVLPYMRCLLIYDSNDPTFRQPLWVSSAFESTPDGTVTTDSLRYEFDVPRKKR
jgi:hypothetical protein